MAFLQEPSAAREPIFRAPTVVVGLIAVLILAHVARVWAPAATSDYVLNTFALQSIVYTMPATWFERLVPPITYAFLHGGTLHLAVNSVWLLAFGPVIARRFGALPFLAFFFLSGIAGAVAFVAFDWGQNNAAIGASGAISGLMGGAIRMMRINRPDLNIVDLPLESLFSRQVAMFSAVWLALNYLTGTFAIGTMGSGEVVAWQAHLGGYIAGLLLSGPFDQFFGLTARMRRVAS